MQEGVYGEASSLAGSLSLDNLVLIWDDNGVTIGSGTDETFPTWWRILAAPDRHVALILGRQDLPVLASMTRPRVLLFPSSATS